MTQCLREEVVQSYLDRELTPQQMQSAAAHITACAICADAVSEAESEMKSLAVAFEVPVDVPTIGLRERLDRQLAEFELPRDESSTDFDHPSPAWFPLPINPAFKSLHAYALALIVVGAAVGLGVHFSNRNSGVGTSDRELIAQTENGNRLSSSSDETKKFDANKSAVSADPEVAPRDERRSELVRHRGLLRKAQRRAGQASVKLAAQSLVAKHQPDGEASIASESEAVKARLMLALHITSVKLNFAQREAQRTFRHRREPVS